MDINICSWSYIHKHLFNSHINMYMHVYLLEWVRKYMGAYKHSYIQETHPTCVYVCNICMYACMHACMHACMYVCMYGCMDVRARLHAHVHTYGYMEAHTCVRNQAFINVPTNLHKHFQHTCINAAQHECQRWCNFMWARARREFDTHIHSKEYISSYILSYVMCEHIHHIGASTAACSLRKQHVRAVRCNRSKPSHQALQQELLALDPEAWEHLELHG